METHTHRESHVKIAPGVGVMQGQSQCCLGSSEARNRQERMFSLSLYREDGPADTLISNIYTPKL